MMEKVADCPTHRFSIMECALLVLQGCKCPCSFRMDPQYGPIQCFYKGSIDRVQEMIDSVSVSSESSVSWQWQWEQFKYCKQCKQFKLFKLMKLRHNLEII